MTAQARTQSEPSPATATYIYGIGPAGMRPPRRERPVGGLDAPLAKIRNGAIAALTSPVDMTVPLGTPEDLIAHQRVLDSVARRGPVLPMRFGAVLSDEAAVADELLAPHHDEFAAALRRLSGHVQYTLKIRYEQDTVLREVLAGDPEVARLRADGTGSMQDQIRLGELVVRALERLRATESVAILDELGAGHEVRVHQPASPEDVVAAAVLVSAAGAVEFEQRVEQFAAAHDERLHVRLVGPSPAYDFVEEG